MSFVRKKHFKNISYKEFKTELFRNLTPEEKNILLYWTLFVTSSEEELINAYKINITEGRKKVETLLRKSKTLKERIKKDRDFVMKFVDNEFLTNYLIAAEIESQLQEKWKVDVLSLQQQRFPDIVLTRIAEGNVSVELKRIISTGNLVAEFTDKVLPYIKDESKNKNKHLISHPKFLLILLFPILPIDVPQRVNQLIEGFYIYEKELGGNQKNRKLICHCITEGVEDEKYTLTHLIECVSNYLNQLD